MKTLNIRKIVALILFLLVASVFTPSCVSSSKLESQKASYMLQDRSEYSRNKSKYKGGTSYRKDKRRNRQYKKKYSKRRR